MASAALWRQLRSYRCMDWLKFAIPFATATIALVLSFLFVVDCQSSIYVAGKWHGIFTHANRDSGVCVPYRHQPVSSLPQDPQLLAAQIGSCVVLALGFPLWICLAASPCWKRPNQVWPKIISSIIALFIGNAQLFTVVKFVRFVLTAYPDEKAYYARRLRVVGSVFFWLLTGVAIPLCGVQLATPVLSQEGAPMTTTTTSTNRALALAKVESEDTHDTKVELQVQASDSAESKDSSRDVEEGMITIRVSSSEDTEADNDMKAIEMSLSST